MEVTMTEKDISLWIEADCKYIEEIKKDLMLSLWKQRDSFI